MPDIVEIINYIHAHGLSAAALQGNHGLAIGFVATAGMLDGINPCSVHLMLLLVGYLLLFVKNRKRANRIGFIFIATIFITYFVFGAALSAAIGSLLLSSWYFAANTALTWSIAAILAVSAVINLKDAVRAQSATIDMKDWESSFFAKRLKNMHIPGTILLAFISTLFLLPCSLPLYLGSVHILANTFGFGKSLFYIFLYSLMFVVPLFIILSVLFGAEQYVNVENFSPEYYRKLRFFEGLVQLAVVALLLLY